MHHNSPKMRGNKWERKARENEKRSCVRFNVRRAIVCKISLLIRHGGNLAMCSDRIYCLFIINSVNCYAYWIGISSKEGSHFLLYLSLTVAWLINLWIMIILYYLSVNFVQEIACFVVKLRIDISCISIRCYFWKHMIFILNFTTKHATTCLSCKGQNVFLLRWKRTLLRDSVGSYFNVHSVNELYKESTEWNKRAKAVNGGVIVASVLQYIKTVRTDQDDSITQLFIQLKHLLKTQPADAKTWVWKWLSRNIPVHDLKLVVPHVRDTRDSEVVLHHIAILDAHTVICMIGSFVPHGT